ncbi:MAG: hypothetical protein JJW01_00115 [Alphaproteobacteria bacterium]|nr:hypothetical protein [Rickettsiales bacterium]
MDKVSDKNKKQASVDIYQWPIAPRKTSHLSDDLVDSAAKKGDDKKQASVGSSKVSSVAQRRNRDKMPDSLAKLFPKVNPKSSPKVKKLASHLSGDFVDPSAKKMDDKKQASVDVSKWSIAPRKTYKEKMSQSISKFLSETGPNSNPQVKNSTRGDVIEEETVSDTASRRISFSSFRTDLKQKRGNSTRCGGMPRL